MNRKIRLADYVFQFLAEKNSEHVFLLPGGGAMHLVDAAGQTEGLSVIPCHHEQAAGISAEAHGRIKGRPGVALVTTGPGATNIVTPVAGAWIESVPMIIISGQAKRADLIGDSGVRQKGVQEVNIVEMVKSVTKYAVTITEPMQIRQHLEQAWHLATSGRQGPVWLDIPLDVQASMIETEQLEGWQAPPELVSYQTDLACDSIINQLSKAHRPLLMIGHGVRLSGAADILQALYERLKIPVATTWNAMDMIPYDHPLNAGKPGSVALRGANFAVQNCDLLIAIGARLDPVVTAYSAENFARSATRIVVDIDQAELDKLQAHDFTVFRADAREVLLKLLDQSSRQPTPDWSEWVSTCKNWKQRYPINDGKAFPDKGEISSYHLTEALSDALPENQLITTGSSGLAVEAFYTAFRNKPGQRIMLTSGLGSMGYGLPAAIGACLANGRKPMVAIESDGSLQLNLQELSTLASLQLPVCMFIMNNAGYASIRNTQRNYFDSRFVGTGAEAGLLIPDILAVAEAIGLKTQRITCVEKLEAGIKEALQTQGPLICDVTLISDETLWPKSAALPQKDGSMLSMPLEDMSPLLSLEELKENMCVPLHPASLSARQDGTE
ncbi:thiamine pyrophosphate-binding protein [Neptuniibacter halophilus]|uniref:thiamine pyrophosphate-binding protein n=1 Tax=Neptuniibacter halophilus TaxID=651666 RepID=UPI002572A891|nr:thiamine pyrophosphate-binding protein [Neptuniibacter halophilus]